MSGPDGAIDIRGDVARVSLALVLVAVRATMTPDDDPYPSPVPSGSLSGRPRWSCPVQGTSVG